MPSNVYLQEHPSHCQFLVFRRSGLIYSCLYARILYLPGLLIGFLPQLPGGMETLTFCLAFLCWSCVLRLKYVAFFVLHLGGVKWCTPDTVVQISIFRCCPSSQYLPRELLRVNMAFAFARRSRSSLSLRPKSGIARYADALSRDHRCRTPNTGVRALPITPQLTPQRRWLQWALTIASPCNVIRNDVSH